MSKNLKQIIDKKVAYEVGQLYNFLNNEEDNIKSYLTAESLKSFYNIKDDKHRNRSICPLPTHMNASNPTSFKFNDAEECFYCHGCKQGGNYLHFIAIMQGYSGSNKINKAKLFVAVNFANINLGFDSLEIYKNEVERLVELRFKKTNSLNYKDYYDISLLNTHTVPITIKRNRSDCHIINSTYNPEGNKIQKENNFQLPYLDLELETRKAKAQSIIKNGELEYNIALHIANQSKLINDFTTNDNLNSRKSLYEFMEKKYDLSKDSVDKFKLIYFEGISQPSLTCDDFFLLNDRVLFPIVDHDTGKIVGYQARTTQLGNKGLAKYLNISDYGPIKINSTKNYRGLTPLNIGQFLFNLYELKNKNISHLFVTEGVADAIKLASLDYDCISPGQSNLTDSQIYLIDKYFGKEVNIYLFFDNDSNNIGQNNSIRIANRLFQFGFTNINIVRTFSELGTDVTDVSTKIKNDSSLKNLVELWMNNCYQFKPASEESLNQLYETGIFSNSELLQIDPRNIKKLLENSQLLSKISKSCGLNYKELSILKPLCNIASKKSLTLLKSKLDILKENDNDCNITINDSISTNIAKVKSQNKEHDWDSLDNITAKQLFRLKKKFDFEVIKNINTYSSKKQINAIVGNIIKEKDFNVWDYIPSNIKDSNDDILDDGWQYVKKDELENMPF